MKTPAIAAALTFSTSIFAGVCQLPGSDPDDDGFGWENDASCVVVDLNSSSATSSDCIDTPPVGDGWGWNGTGSCQIGISGQTVPNQPSSSNPSVKICEFPLVSDPDGDGFGWENDDSCIVDSNTASGPATTVSSNPVAELLKGGKWYCDFRYPHISANIQYNNQPHFPRIDAWSTQPQVVCGSKCAGPGANNHRLSFSENNFVIERYSSGFWQGNETLPWSVNRMQMQLGNISIQKFAFEQFNGSEYFHYYLNDTDRWTCKRQ